jgi:hypothetical protein
VTRTPPGLPRGKGESPPCAWAMLFGDHEAEADAHVVGPDAFVTAKKWLGERGNHLGRERLAGVLDRELPDVGASRRGSAGAVLR